MYDNHPNNPPPPTVELPGKYAFVAWVQMRDFIFNYGDWTFYGLLAQNPSGRQRLCARHSRHQRSGPNGGTTSPRWPWRAMPGFGDVGYGFFRIYQTLRMISLLTPPGAEGCGVGRPGRVDGIGRYALPIRSPPRCSRHAAETSRPRRKPPRQRSRSPSPGTASAARWLRSMWRKIRRPRKSRRPCCARWRHRASAITTFKTIFNGLGIQSWRIVNEPDLHSQARRYFPLLAHRRPSMFTIPVVDDAVAAGMLAFDLHLSALARSEASRYRIRLAPGRRRRRLAGGANDADLRAPTVRPDADGLQLCRLRPRKKSLSRRLPAPRSTSRSKSAEAFRRLLRRLFGLGDDVGRRGVNILHQFLDVLAGDRIDLELGLVGFGEKILVLSSSP